MATALHARYVLGYAEGDHALWENATIVYDGSVIEYVGPRQEHIVDQEVDLGESIVIPGLIDLDAVSDIAHAILDSWSSPRVSPGLQWASHYFASDRTGVFDQDERDFIRRYALAQLLLHGVTTAMPIASEVHSEWAETYQDAVGIATAARELGIRTYVGPSYRSGVTVTLNDGTKDVWWDAERGCTGLKDAKRFLDYIESCDDDLVRGALLPCRIETVTVALLEATARLARQQDVPVRLHSMQSESEIGLLKRWYDASAVDLYRQTGLLECRLLIPHAIFGTGDRPRRSPSDAELAALAQSGVSIVHCPATSLRYATALDTFDRFEAAGVNITLGSDSFPPDLLRSMHEGANVAKLLEGRLDAGSLAAYFRAATLNAAAAVGRDDLGRLAPGAQADLVAYRLDDFRLGIVEDPLRTLVAAASPSDLVLSVVAGRTVVEKGKIHGIDLDRMRGKAQALFEKMRSAYGERDYLGRDADDLFPPLFARAGEERVAAPWLHAGQTHRRLT